MNLALDPTRSVSVAASAGSGKTWQLVSRIVRLLLAGAEPGSILALTFTRKAASEMRERVEARLRELAYADGPALAAALHLLDLEDSEPLRTRARALHERLLFASFGLRAQTLHAFCQDLLSRFAVEAEVPAGFTLVENEREVQARAFEHLLDRIRRESSGRAAAALDQLIAMGARETTIRTWLKGFIDRRSDWWAYTETWADDGKDVVAAASAQAALDLDIDPQDASDPDYAFAASEFIAQLQQIHDLLLAAGGLGHLKAAMLAPALLAADAATRGTIALALLTAAGARRAVKIKKGVSEATFAQFMGLYESLCSVIERVRELRLRRATWQRTRAAFTLGAALLDAFTAQLRAANALTFADLEWRSYRLLRDPGQAEWVRYKLDSRLDHLLLDEFQDTNPTQWSLLLPLLAEMAAGDPERARTVFVVGDAKQSIYSFRRANPELMTVAATTITQDLGGVSMPLNDSRRSAPAIIDFVNALFDGAEGAAIGFEPHGTWRREDWGAVEIAPLVRAIDADTVPHAHTGLRYPLTTPRLVAEDLRLHTEARQIAERIDSLIAARLPIRDEGAVRALGCDDIMILARQRTHLHAIERALAERGIAFVGSSKGTLLDTVIAHDLIALLRFLDAPHRDLELAQTLRSPLFGASDDDLVNLARARSTSWWQSLLGVVAAGTASAKLARAAGLLESWLAAARRLPAHDLLDRIDHEADVAARYEAALPGDARVRANLGAFLQLVLDADQGRYPTLGRLNRQLEELTAAGNDSPDEAPPPATGGTVRVMTIHAAKGLEAPAVFLVNSAPTATSRSDGWLVEWPSGDRRPRHLLLAGRADSSDAVSRLLADNQKTRDAREALNLLYVAVTRARQFLFVSAFESKRGDSAASWHGRCRDAVVRLANDSSPLPGARPDAVGQRSGVFPEIADVIATAVQEPVEDERLRKPFAQLAALRAPSFEAGGLRDADAAARGVAIHWLIQQLADGRAIDEATLAARLHAVVGEALDPTQIPLWLSEAQRVRAAPALARFFDAAVVVQSWNEVAVQSLIEDELRSGVIDRLVDDGNTLWVLDYKTAPRPQAERMSVQYSAQLAAYADGVAKLWPGRAVVAGLVLTATQTWVEVLQR